MTIVIIYDEKDKCDICGLSPVQFKIVTELKFYEEKFCEECFISTINKRKTNVSYNLQKPSADKG